MLDPEVIAVMVARLRAAGRSASELDLLTVARIAGAFVALGTDVRGASVKVSVELPLRCWTDVHVPRRPA